MKNYIKYIVLISVGILLGWVLFGNSEQVEEQINKELVDNVEQQFTCSMHPQISQPEEGSCPICGMDLIPLIQDDEGLNANEFKMSENALALANIETAILETKDIGGSSMTFTGKININEKTSYVQTAHFGGRIEKLYINATGEMVNKGQLLAAIYSPELVTTQKELLTALRTKNSDPTLYNAVRNKLKIWKLSETQISNIEEEKEIITNFPIYSNVTGVVTTKLVEEGAHLKEGQGLFKIANLSSVWADFDVYEKQIPLVQINDELLIHTHANPNEIISSKVSFIDPILNKNTRTVTMRATLNNFQGILKPGMFIEGELKSSKIEIENQQAIVIPKSSVLWTGKRSVVYVRKKGVEPIFEMRSVTLGAEINGSYEILEGLNENEEIVIHGTFSVDAAAQLLGKKSMMSSRGNENVDELKSDKELKGTENLNIEPLKVSNSFIQQFQKVYDAYIELKDALVNDDASSSKRFAENLRSELNKVESQKMENTVALNHWKDLEKIVNETSANISSSDDISNQRMQFLGLSNEMIKGLDLFDIGRKIYVQFCPMANNDKGGFWLSNEEKIMNPYFGDMMLNCGNIDRIINK